ncbi:GNAT family N-acetyltransferase [Kribbella sp. NPDC055071]
MPVQSLADILHAVERGVFPPADLAITVVPPPSNRESAVIAFTGHIVIAADVDAAWVAEHLPPDDLAAPTNPPFLTALEQATDRRVSSLDAMLLAPALTNSADRTAETAGLTELTDLAHHHRVARALQYRDDVHVYGADQDPSSGFVVIGRGLAGRLEVAIEVPDHSKGQGHGRRLAMAARALIPPETHIWAQITPGNAASLRAFLAAGYAPVGSEALLIK